MKLKIETKTAYLVDAITYTKDGNEITVPKNTVIIIDAERETALIGDDHVYVESNEYKLIQT